MLFNFVSVSLIKDISHSDKHFGIFSFIYFELGEEIRAVLHLMYSLLTSNLKESKIDEQHSQTPNFVEVR